MWQSLRPRQRDAELAPALVSDPVHLVAYCASGHRVVQPIDVPVMPENELQDFVDALVLLGGVECELCGAKATRVIIKPRQLS